MSSLQHDEHILDLLCEHATAGLDSQADAALRDTLGDAYEVETRLLDLAAAELDLGMTGAMGTEELPASLRDRVESDAVAWLAEAAGLRTAGSEAVSSSASSQKTDSGGPATTAGSGFFLWTGWIAAAACLVIAVLAARPAAQASPAERLAALELTSTNLVRAGWAGIDAAKLAEAPHQYDGGVTGEVIWDAEANSGFMKISGITPNNPSEYQYQLWIFDKTRDAGDLTQRPVDGGVFDITSTGEVIVPIDAKLPVGEAILFAVTVEPPGGVVVSDRDIAFVAPVG